MIREAEKKDIERMIIIEKDCDNNYLRWGKTGFLSEFEKEFSKTFVYEDNESVVGFINFWEIGDEIEINTLAVLKSERRQGIGEKLIDFVIKRATELKSRRIILEVSSNNIPAISLYKKKFFQVYNVRKKYYDLKYDALLMERRI
ncbi:MAG: GNAT family N-acetyltransferase [Elusimicrobiota bacterium]